MWGPRQEEPPRVSACNLYFQKLESLAYIFVTGCMGLSSFNFVQWLPRDTSFLHQVRFDRSRSFRIIQGRWFWYQSKARIRLPIVSHCDYGPILHSFWDTVTYWLKIAYFSYPSLTRSLCFLWNFWLKLTMRKLMGLSYSEDRMRELY